MFGMDEVKMDESDTFGYIHVLLTVRKRTHLGREVQRCPRPQSSRNDISYDWRDIWLSRYIWMTSPSLMDAMSYRYWEMFIWVG
jgi:hypothetical protein